MENKQNFKLIAHALVKVNDKYLLIKRTPIKRGKPNSLPEYWDIPGGMVEEGETPSIAAIRETKEEVNLLIKPTIPIHEDSNLDIKKDTIFIRLVYLSDLNDDISNIKLDPKEHTEYKFIENIQELEDELISPFLIELFEKDL